MNIKTEIIKNYLADYITNTIEDFEIDANEIVDTMAIKMLSEIQKIVINDKNTDFDVVEQIVSLFEKNNINCGSRHDF